MTTQPLTAGIDHVGLTVRDLNLTRAFFIDCLGVLHAGRRLLIFGVGLLPFAGCVPVHQVGRHLFPFAAVGAVVFDPVV